MERENLEKVKLTTRQIFLYLIDGLVTYFKPFDRHGIYYKNINDYFAWREFDRKRFRDNLRRLGREGFIKTYLKDNQSIIELTNKGKEKIRLILAQDFEFKYPKSWDGKWRMIIFDVPNKKNKARDILRDKLKSMGCFRLQESVFVFPFDCKDVIDYLKNLYEISPYVQYVIAEGIETEVNLINYFLSSGLLKKTMLSKNSIKSARAKIIEKNN